MCLCSPLTRHPHRPSNSSHPPLLISQMHPCLCWLLTPLLEASGGSRTTAVLMPRLPTSTPTLTKRFPRVPVSYPHYNVPSAEHPHGSHCSGVALSPPNKTTRWASFPSSYRPETGGSENNISVVTTVKIVKIPAWICLTLKSMLFPVTPCHGFPLL